VPDVWSVTGVSGKGTMKNFKAMMAEARLPERTVDVCLRGDLVADFQALEAELDAARIAAGDSLDAGTEADGIIERMEAVKALMRESTYPVRLRAMRGPDFRALFAQHPPRRNDAGEIDAAERGFDFNVDTFFEPLLRACLVDPEIVSKDDWDSFVGGITDYQFNELAITCLSLNRGKVDIPFSLAASQMKRTSGGE
jgi:hypothetical protein